MTLYEPDPAQVHRKDTDYASIGPTPSLRRRWPGSFIYYSTFEVSEILRDSEGLETATLEEATALFSEAEW